MKRVVSPIGVRTALIAGLVMLSLALAAPASASRDSCSGSISAPNTARRGSSITVTATAVEGEQFDLFLFGDSNSFLLSGDVTNNGNFAVTVTVPMSSSTGGATLGMDMASPSTCFYPSPITILAKLVIPPGVTITNPPALTTTTAAAPQVTTTTTSPNTTTAAPQSSSTTTASSTSTTVPVSTSTSTESLAETTTLESTSISLVAAAPPTDSGGGQPWSAWITGGLIGLMLGAAGMLAVIRKGVLKV